MINILYNGHFYRDVLDQKPVSALAISSDKIVAYGSDEEILDRFPSPNSKINLEGRTVLPGLIDSHIHLSQYGLGLQRVDCETETLPQCLDRVKSKSKILPPDSWLLGHGWNQNTWGGRFGTKTLLDEISDQHPIFLTAKSLHAAWCNSKALQIANISGKTPDPDGGSIQKDEKGNPTGILFESAMELVERVIPPPTKVELYAAIQHAQMVLNRSGITGVHDFDQMDCFSTLEDLLANDDLKLRVVKGLPLAYLDEALKLGIHSGFGDPLLRFGAVKLFSDGALGPQTAAMLQPYGSSTDRGLLLMDEGEILEIGKRAIKGRFPLSIHAIGDRANRVVINSLIELYLYAEQRHLPVLRHRIEHLQLIAPSDLELLRGSGITASMQPYHMISDQQMADRQWGERCEFSYAWRSIADTGTVLAFGSDAPVESPNPYASIHAATTRLPAGYADLEGWYPAQKITVREAINGFTVGAAYAAGMEKQVGKLLEGYYADLIVLDVDPFSIPLINLPVVKTSATMVGGRWVWKGF